MALPKLTIFHTHQVCEWSQWLDDFSWNSERKFFTITDCPILKAHGLVCLSRCSFCQDCCWLTLCSRSGFRRSHRVRRLQPSVIHRVELLPLNVGLCGRSAESFPTGAVGWVHLLFRPPSLLWRCWQTFLLPHLMLGSMEIFRYASCHSLEQIQQSQQRQVEGHCRTQSVPASHELQTGVVSPWWSWLWLSEALLSLQPAWSVHPPPQNTVVLWIYAWFIYALYASHC